MEPKTCPNLKFGQLMREREECAGSALRVPGAARGVKLTLHVNLGFAHSHFLPELLIILDKEFQVISILTAKLGAKNMLIKSVLKII